MLRALLLLPLLSVGSPLAAGAKSSCAALPAIEGSDAEIALACAQYAAVGAYFADLGLAAHPVVTVRFEETVHIEGSSYPVTGQYFADDHLVEMTRLASQAPARLLHWQQPWTVPMAASILDHEFAHVFVEALLPSALPHAWNEFVAYAVQFELMEPELRRRIVSAYPDAVPFEDASSVCDLSYVVDFDLFGLRAYLTAEAKGGPAYVRALLNGEVPTGAPRRFECP